MTTAIVDAQQYENMKVALEAAHQLLVRIAVTKSVRLEDAVNNLHDHRVAACKTIQLTNLALHGEPFTGDAS